MTSEEIKTSLDDLIDLISEKGEVKVEEAKGKLGLDEESVTNLARILQSHEIVKIYYSIVGEMILKPGKKFQDSLMESASIEQAKEEASSSIEKAETEKFDKILNNIRKKIMEKKKKKLKD